MGSFHTEYKYYKGERVGWYRPADLETLLKLKQQHPAARLVCGNTEVGRWRQIIRLLVRLQYLTKITWVHEIL